ncbi:MAG TPA: sugar phosphate nucleotidyltransferase [Candidatus Saccharimonadaceae bacterium]|nr:sugar phosphate nucleotidyltransferase [Candidatus Saccharimonadaceae bacterium]
MIIVIIAGGSGTRLWPLSTSTKPKQLLKLTGERTMVQATYDRARQLGETVYVVTEASHADALRAQLPELSSDRFIIEPGRRSTASCVILALDTLQPVVDNDEPIAFLSADHLIRDIDGLTRSFSRAGELSQQYGREVLVGIEPTYASTGFGYIEKGSTIDDGRAYEVASYKEKPNLELAESFLGSGKYLWNAGYFVGSVNTFLREMREFAPQLFQEYESLQNAKNDEYLSTYLGFENVAIDVALNEKVKGLMVVPASFDWMDVGNFKDLHDANPKNADGNYISGEAVHTIEVENSYIRNEENKPIAVIGLANVVVVNTPDGLLVARKDLVHRVGEVAKEIQQ